MTSSQAVTAQWLETIDALRFATGEAQRHCFMHRLAFRRFLGPDVTDRDCLAFFDMHRAAFQEAAATKGAGLSACSNFHINSRDLARALRLAPATSGPIDVPPKRRQAPSPPPVPRG